MIAGGLYATETPQAKLASYFLRPDLDGFLGKYGATAEGVMTKSDRVFDIRNGQRFFPRI